MVYLQSLSLYELCLFHFEFLNFEDEILLKEGRNVTPGFSNPEWWTQDDDVMKNSVLLYWFTALISKNKLLKLWELLIFDLVVNLSAF